MEGYVSATVLLVSAFLCAILPLTSLICFKKFRHIVFETNVRHYLFCFIGGHLACYIAVLLWNMITCLSKHMEEIVPFVVLSLLAGGILMSWLVRFGLVGGVEDTVQSVFNSCDSFDISDRMSKCLKRSYACCSFEVSFSIGILCFFEGQNLHSLPMGFGLKRVAVLFPLVFLAILSIQFPILICKRYYSYWTLCAFLPFGFTLLGVYYNNTFFFFKPLFYGFASGILFQCSHSFLENNYFSTKPRKTFCYFSLLSGLAVTAIIHSLLYLHYTSR